jgi:hypothetical protein
VAFIDGIFNGLARFAREFGFTWAGVQNGQLSRYVGIFALGGVIVMVIALFGVMG